MANEPMNSPENTPNKDTNSNGLHPNIDLSKLGITVSDIQSDAELHLKAPETPPHKEVLKKLLRKILKVDFHKEAGLKDAKMSLGEAQLHIIVVAMVLHQAEQNNWGLCSVEDIIYLYNGAFWKRLGKHELKNFLGRAARQMGLDRFKTDQYRFQDELYKQFLSQAFMAKPDRNKEVVLLNLLDGTYEIGPDFIGLRPHKRSDFLLYQLPYAYDAKATAPLFRAFLDKVLPDIPTQMVLQEFIGYVFIKHLKLEKALILFGNGANGKSVFFEIICALLGAENVTGYSLQSLTSMDSKDRAHLEGKFLNYTSEMHTKMDTDLFKRLVSGEPVPARMLYQEPFMMDDYGKLMFNANALPKDVEQTDGFFRRFQIVPFNVKIPETEQDKDLARKVIGKELPGVLNWALEGMHRLLKNKRFTESEAVHEQLLAFKKQSDSVLLFLDENDYEKAVEVYKPLSELYEEYKTYCFACQMVPCAKRNFSARLNTLGIPTEKKMIGQVVFIRKKV